MLGMDEVNTRTVDYDSEGGESLFGTSAKLRKATIIFVVSVPASVRLSAWNNLAPTGRIFMKFCICLFFLFTFKKMQVTFKLDKNKG
jgi:hypothetical protein